MDKIWDRNPLKSEVIARCGGDEKNRMITQIRQNANAKRNIASCLVFKIQTKSVFIFMSSLFGVTTWKRCCVVWC